MAKKLRTRELNGRVQRLSAEQSRIEIQRPVLEKRCRDLGLRPTYENLRKVESPDYGTEWGRLYLRNEITQSEKLAAGWFSELHAGYLKAICSPRPTPKNSRLDGLSGGAPDVPDDWATAKRDEWASVEATMRKRLTRYQITAVKSLCCESLPQRPEWVKPGIKVLVEIHIDGARKAA